MEEIIKEWQDAGVNLTHAKNRSIKAETALVEAIAAKGGQVVWQDYKLSANAEINRFGNKVLKLKIETLVKEI